MILINSTVVGVKYEVIYPVAFDNLLHDIEISKLVFFLGFLSA